MTRLSLILAIAFLLGGCGYITRHGLPPFNRPPFENLF